MASNAAVISLKQTIQRLLNSSHIFIIPPITERALRSAYADLKSLQRVLGRLDGNRSSERVSVLDGEIRDAVHKLEDALESHISDLFLQPQSESLLGGVNLPFSISIDLKDLKEEYPLAKLRKEYIKEASNPTLPEKDAAAAANSSITTDFGGKKQSRMVGLSVHEYSKLKDHLLCVGTCSRAVVSLVGMAGIGKTTLAKQIFGDPTVSNYFSRRLWVTVGPTNQLEDIVQSIRVQMTPDSNKTIAEKDEELFARLAHERYLIVLDDIWKCKVWDDWKKLVPIAGNGCGVLVTTRMEEISTYVSKDGIFDFLMWSSCTYHQIQMRLLDKEESWNLLQEEVFGEGLCPSKLEKAGKKIAKNCDGLPLVIVTIATLLSKAEKTVEYWKKVAKRGSSVFVEAYDRMSNVLIPSYHNLPQYLKVCFLYMGVFPQNYEIPTSKLINLWSAEGFAETGKSKNAGKFAMECLKNLVSNNILMVRQHSYDCRIKTCSLHSAFWHLCIRVAGNNKFLHVLNSFRDGIAKGMEGQRRLCIHNSILFGIKDVYNSMASISAAHSLLCTGQHHQYPVPLCLGLRLLRLLNAVTIRFYEFPVEVLNLVHLRYLALTYNGKLPASISQLWNLQFLIIRQHLSIKCHADSSYLPVEIWGMKELKHLEIMGSDLPDPNDGAFLGNLIKLLDVSPRSCTKGVLGNIPHLKKLGIQIELAPDAAELLSCFEYIFNLYFLESLKCFIVNPILMSEVVAPPPALLSMLPSRLKKLSLSGFGYGWEEMSEIASLPKLKVLKLRCYAFQGPEWSSTHEKKFSKLKYLLIEDTDLVRWRCDYECFPSLECLIIRHCYKLKEIPLMCCHSKLRMIEVVDSNPSVVTWAKQAHEKLRDNIERYNLHDKCGNRDSIFKVKEMAPN